MTFDAEFVLTGLQPFTEYSIALIATNLYTLRRSIGEDDGQGGRLFGVRTSEGGVYSHTYPHSCPHILTLTTPSHTHTVPDPPTIDSVVVFGTASVQLNWTKGAELRGEPANLVYYILSLEGIVINEVTVPTAILNGSIGLRPGSDQDLQVKIL